MRLAISRTNGQRAGVPHAQLLPGFRGGGGWFGMNATRAPPLPLIAKRMRAIASGRSEPEAMLPFFVFGNNLKKTCNSSIAGVVCAYFPFKSLSCPMASGDQSRRAVIRV